MSLRRASATGLILVLLTLTLYLSTVLIPLNVTGPVEVHIRDGMTFTDALNTLREKRLIRDSGIFLILGRMTGIEGRIKSGYYAFHGRVTPYSAVRNIMEGHVVEKTVTIPEGYNIWQISKRLQETGIMGVEEFLYLAYKREFLDELKIDAPSIEGYIFPDTYRIPHGMEPESVLRVMVGRMRMVFTEDIKMRASELGFSEKEVITLASIIEREAKLDEERPLISAVFHNRLKIGMPLQADPTSIYGLKGVSSRITYKDLRRETPYNTYQIKGLPIGPIASPGYESLMAALYPATVPYLYFVSQNNGRHHFSVTEVEHIKAARRYRLLLSEMER